MSSNIYMGVEEIEDVDRTDPYSVVALLVHTLCNYDPEDTSTFYEMLQYLLGDYQPISELTKQNIKDRMLQNDKYEYIGESYFNGAVPENDYTPDVPYEIEVKENPYTDSEEGYKKLYLKSNGADSPRPITLRLAKDGNYYVWGDSFMGLLADIKSPESDNPWT